ncbi:MAG: helix-turn-helix domain-containing protein [Proteobacteria bacterium]|nr:helix-turn-helix domain-containing protein [Pseudomonadota bacterium]
MIKQDKRIAVFQLHGEGRGKREISRLLGIGRNTVTAIIAAEGRPPEITRNDAIDLDEETLRRIHAACDGRIQRVHEILTEEEHIGVGYSTLCRKLREIGLGGKKQPRSQRVPDEAGEEMQHDTTVYFLRIGSHRIKVVASLLYFRYSKVRYLKFYRNFDRFRMKCFLHGALTHFGYAAATCIIDNTNLARLRGSGKNAVIVPEMERFGRKYGFGFQCHALNHPNRKAGNERGFYTVETNFLPGRQFETMKELNRSAVEWATVRRFHKGVGKTGIIPSKAFEYEKSFLNGLPPCVEAPCRDHQRVVDQYGYAAFGSNYYWIPGEGRGLVDLLEYDRKIKIFLRRRLLIEYDLPTEIVRNRTYSPEGRPKPAYRPNNRKRPTKREEDKLRSLSKEVDDWLTTVLKEKGIARHRFVRSVYSLHLKLSPSLFLRTIRRAGAYGIADADTIERIAELLLKQSNYVMPEVDVDREFKNRTTYREGRVCDKVNLSLYDELMEENRNG